MANLIYQLQEAGKLWAPSGGDFAFAAQSLANGALRQGARWDRGATAIPERYVWRAWLKVATTPALGSIATLYIATSDGTHTDGDLGAADATINAERRRNLTPIGAIEIDEASTTREFSNSDMILIRARYVIPVIFNELGVALSSTAADFGFSLTPVSLQIQ